MTQKLSPELRDALALYAELEHAVVTAGQNSAPDGKVRLVQARRKFAEQLGRVGIMIGEDEMLSRHPETQQDMVRYFSAFRYALGQHQANWPAVKIDEDREGYAESAKNAYAKSDAFWDWCGTNLDFRQSPLYRAGRAA